MVDTVVLKAPRKWHLYSMDFGMAFVDENKCIAHTPVMCRDYLHDIIRTFLNNKRRVRTDSHPYYPRNGDKNLCMDKLRMMFMINSNKLDGFFHGINVLNIKERSTGIEPTIYHVAKLKKVPKSMDAYTILLVEGSAEYMNNPHLLSALTLILRFCTKNKVFNYTEVGDLTEAYLAMKATGKGMSDGTLMGTCHNKIHTIMKYRNELFEGLELKDLFPVNIDYRFHETGGIQNLCKFNSPNKVVNERLGALFSKK